MSKGLEVRVWRDYDKFIAELTNCFPHEAAGIRKFYDECWRVCCRHVHSAQSCFFMLTDHTCMNTICS